MLFGVAFWMVGRSVKRYRRLVSGLNVGYSVCLGFAMIYATNTIRITRNAGVLMSSICRNWFSFSNVTRPAGNQGGLMGVEFRIIRMWSQRRNVDLHPYMKG